MSKSTLEKFPVQRVGLHNITVDHELQSRVQMDVEHARALSEVRAEGREFSMPVVLFFDGRTYWLADGFHRHWAATAFGDVDILAEVRSGTKKDAMVFSAGANQEFSLKRTKEDIRKAVWMLFGVEEWWRKADVALGQHVGVTPNTVKKFRAFYSNETGTKLPDMVTRTNGTVLRHRSRRPVDDQGNFVPTLTQAKNGNYLAWIDGKPVSFGYYDKERAEKRLAETLASRESRKDDRRKSLNTNNILSYFSARCLSFEGIRFSPGIYMGLHGFKGHGYTCTQSELGEVESVYQAVGRVMLLRESQGAGDGCTKLAVVCYPDDGNPRIIELARSLGVEFITPDDLATKLGAANPSDN